ncbi:hypothetical protein P171DRAFT_435025 [Karstenula rhodostoma CBS 690.94]|uniref:T6SS Phospholipase effector Tle1-like catalytic domain-containing protein n=1 Tax=Karstenula rhodostoma CBS 690.94 TaxID=1392251 RepID=A0A9P4PDV1_9PLEO|nr:hypothetical protein P171DRAFT_435025 [Karstenula rhodostoma CBS 690.94]
MQRSKFPRTARSSARVIRHAVSIDERRAKFRQDLISQVRPNRPNYYKLRWRKPALTIHTLGEQRRGRSPAKPNGRRETLAVPGGTRDCSQISAGIRNASSAYMEMNSAATSLSNLSLDAIHNRENYDFDDEGACCWRAVHSKREADSKELRGIILLAGEELPDGSADRSQT